MCDVKAVHGLSMVCIKQSNKKRKRKTMNHPEREKRAVSAYFTTGKLKAINLGDCIYAKSRGWGASGANNLRVAGV